MLMIGIEHMFFFQEYYDELIRSKKHDGIKLSYGGKHGKGPYRLLSNYFTGKQYSLLV